MTLNTPEAQSLGVDLDALLSTIRPETPCTAHDAEADLALVDASLPSLSSEALEGLAMGGGAAGGWDGMACVAVFGARAELARRSAHSVLGLAASQAIGTMRQRETVRCARSVAR